MTRSQNGFAPEASELAPPNMIWIPVTGQEQVEAVLHSNEHMLKDPWSTPHLAFGSLDADGKKDGPWRVYERKSFEPGFMLCREQTYEADKLNGAFVAYHTTAAIHQEGRYKDGMPDGKWTQYNKDGSLREAHYKDGVLDGPYVKKAWKIAGYRPGDLIEEGFYENGQRTGDWICYDYLHRTLYNPDVDPKNLVSYVHKYIAQSCSYVDGKLHGDLLEYGVSGQLLSRERFSQG